MYLQKESIPTIGQMLLRIFPSNYQSNVQCRHIAWSKQRYRRWPRDCRKMNPSPCANDQVPSKRWSIEDGMMQRVMKMTITQAQAPRSDYALMTPVLTKPPSPPFATGSLSLIWNIWNLLKLHSKLWLTADLNWTELDHDKNNLWKV